MGCTLDHYEYQASVEPPSSGLDKLEEQRIFDKLRKPSHYARVKYDPNTVFAEWFKDWPGDVRTAHFLGVALKYICRAGHKDGVTVPDLEKCLHYITEALNTEKAKCS
jgi:hypothetical protein